MMLRALTTRRVSSFSSLSIATPNFRTFLYRWINTLVLGEHEKGCVKISSMIAVSAANFLYDGNSISMLLAGSGSSLKKAANHALSSHPLISQVLLADSDVFLHPLAEPWARLVQLVQQSSGFSHIIAASDSFGKNVLPRAAALLDVSPIADVIEISGPNQFVRPIYGGNAVCSVQYCGPEPCMLTIRPTSFQLPIMIKPPDAHLKSISNLDLSNFGKDGGSKSRFLKHVFEDNERPDLGSARVVVSGGRGLKTKENFQMLEKLANKLGAALGATRAAVDAGFVPNDIQVGQTGKIVAPEVYMAFGISGAIQHLAGMRDSKVIVAINNDADAPIFKVADYGIVGDLFQVIPEMLQKLPDK